MKGLADWTNESAHNSTSFVELEESIETYQ